MKKFILILTVALLAAVPSLVRGETLRSGKYFVTQSWSQEKKFKRAYFVSVPKRKKNQKIPVFIFLHGNGGNAKGAMNRFIRQHRTMASRYVMVFADGYQKSWNVVAERSKADDLEYIEAIVKKLSTYNNVQQKDFSIMGVSNGSALVNQLLIESKLPNIRNYISGVSPLNSLQHDGKNFKMKGDNNNYKTVAKPMTGKRLMNISGTNDRLVPYQGGFSKGIPAKRGRLGFVDAEESIFLWAKQMGYKGKKLTKPSKTTRQFMIFSYLNGDVIHYKVINEGHGATRAISEKLLLQFLEEDD